MRFVLIIALLSLWATQAYARCDSREQVIRLGLAPQSGTPSRVRAIASLTSAINRQLQGRACLKILSDDQRFTGEKSVTALQSGAIELALPSFSDLAAISSDYQVFDLPFAFRDSRTVQRFLMLSGDRLEEPLRPFNAKALAFWHGHFDQISAKQPVLLPEDLAGLKIATDGTTTASYLVAAVNGVEQPVAKSKLPEAIKGGQVEAQFTDWFALKDNKTAIVHEGVTQTNHAFRGHVLLASQSWWDGLSNRIKRPLSELVTRVSQQANIDAQRQHDNARRAIIGSGATVRGLTRHQRKAWLDRLWPVWNEFGNRKLLEIVKQADRAL